MRTRTTTTTLYTFEELSEKAQARAREHLWDINVDDSAWWIDAVAEDIDEFGKVSGLGCTYGKACDIDRGDFVYIQDCHTTFREIQAKATDTARVYPNIYTACIAPFLGTFSPKESRQLLRLERTQYLGILTGETRDGRHGRQAEVERHDSYNGERSPRMTALLDKLEEAWKELLYDLERVYVTMLREEYEYQTSREAIEESIVANEYEFTEEGEIA